MVRAGRDIMRSQGRSGRWKREGGGILGREEYWVRVRRGGWGKRKKEKV